jgi:hypothetical protein
MISRCKWCKPPRYLIHGEWTSLRDPMRYFGDEAEFTDTLCPECFTNQKKKIAEMRKVGDLVL